MALVDLAGVSSLLACPRCHSRLIATDRSFRCSAQECELSAGVFPLVGRLPALIDFEHSIVERDAFGPGGVASRLTGSSRWSVERLPGPIRPVWKPRNSIAARNLERLLSLLEAPSPVVLVVGGATIGNGVEILYRTEGIRLLAFDAAPSSSIQFVGDAHQIPLASGSVDAVIVQAVLEHVLDPQRVVSEIERVLVDRGIVYAETPFLQAVHAGPYDFARFTSSGHRYLFGGFEELAAGAVAGPGTALLWSIDHLVRGLARHELPGKLARAAFFWLRSLDRFVPEAFAMDSGSAYYFLGRRAARRLTAAEIVKYYRGAQGAAAPER
jgi:SAM-dependent methyltransferase